MQLKKIANLFRKMAYVKSKGIFTRINHSSILSH